VAALQAEHALVAGPAFPFGLRTLGERESGTARLEEAVAAFDACLMMVSSGARLRL
jgi:hypothetical protein